MQSNDSTRFDAPIAIVGLAGRFPGARDLAAFWELLDGRGDAVGPVPPERWDASAAWDSERSVQAVGGFLDGVEGFDAGFFGVSPREAAAVDPQQRLMLEMSWRALEDAGQRAADLAGSRTGVYVGASWHDYELLRIARAARATPHSLVGNALDVIAARVSYFLKLRGPSMTVETGCSSSLVALHLAVQALRSGEIGAAVVGGTNLMLDPHVTVGLTHFGGLSPDGRCAAFGAGANGFVRGEGVAALYLKTVERALADGDRIRAVVVRTAVNNDGGGDSLVTPSPDGQEDLLRQVYQDAGLPANAPFYVEAHGTGTDRGDPIEAGALGRVLGRNRSQRLHIGSVKTNIGHLEASAGLAGLIKLVLALEHGRVPASLHSAELNPAIDFDGLNLAVVREPVALPEQDPVYLGLNSFGWGGTNAHVLLRGAPAPSPAPTAGPATGLPLVVPVSAADQPTLRERAGLLAGALAADHPGSDSGSDPLPAGPAAEAVAGLAGVLAWRRDHFPERAAIVTARPADVRPALEALAAGTPEPDGVVIGRARPHQRTAFVFPGQGSQWSRMGQDLYQDSPLFAEVVQRCAAALRPHLDWDPLTVFTGAADDSWMSRIDLLQPTLWAMTLGLAELWRACGVEPDVVLGHSQGEITAATFAGILSYEDGALIVARRSAIARRTSGAGRMLAVDLDRDAAQAALAGFEQTVALAVHNGPTSCVLSGETESVLILKELLEADGTFCRLVNVDYASHSPQMAPLREDLLAALGPARPGPGSIRLLSTTRVAELQGPEMDAGYWTENLSRPVLFAETLSAALDDGVTHVVEISPHPVLVPAIEQLGAERPEPPAVLSTLRRDEGGANRFALALGAAYVAGLEPFGALPRTAADVPEAAYPLHSERHWTEAGSAAAGARHGFDLVPAAVPGEAGVFSAETVVSLEHLPWLGDHRVHGVPVVPAAAMLATALSAARSRLGTAPRGLRRVAFTKAVALADTPVTVAGRWRDRSAGTAEFRLLASGDGAAWDEHAVAFADVRPRDDSGAPEFPAWVGSGAAEKLDPQDFYREWENRGLQYGPAFQTISALSLDGERTRAFGRVELAPNLLAAARPGAPHPALWDGALQVALALVGSDPAAAVVPVAIDRLTFHSDGDKVPAALWSHAVRGSGGSIDVSVFDEDRSPLMTITGLRMRPLGETSADAVDPAKIHRIEWEPVAAVTPDGRSGPWVVCVDGAHDQRGALLADALGGYGAKTTVLDLAADPGAAGLRAALAAQDPVAGVAYLTPGTETGLARLTEAVKACLAGATGLRLTVITTAAQAATGDDVPDPFGALYWGFVRALRREHPELGTRLIDVPAAIADTGADGAGVAPALLAAEVLADDAEDQIALRSGERLAARVTRGRPETPPQQPPLAGRAQPFAIVPPAPGSGGGPRFLPIQRRTPGPGEVEIEVAATTLDPVGRPVRGLVGRVAALGPGTGYQVGDRVAGFGITPVGSHAVLPAAFTRPALDAVDATAAALPLTMAAAWYALVDCAGAEPGETVLVHSAPGGLGQALIAVARHLGFTTLVAADPAAAARLAEVGIDTDIDTGEPDWPEAVRRHTDGRGVDVIISPQAPAEAMYGAAALAPAGRLVALGMVPPTAPDVAAVIEPGQAVSVTVVDLPDLVRRGSRRLARALTAVYPALEDCMIPPIAARAMPFDDPLAALRAVVGERVEAMALTDPALVPAVPPVAKPGGRLRPDGTYVITGGLGALGLALAERFVADGAGALALIGRSAPDAAAAERIAALRGAGTRVDIVSCDVADGPAVDAALRKVRERLPPIHGVVHAAGILADATVGTLTADRIEQVLAPKTAGVRHLDAATAADPLDFFVVFSSAAAVVGNPGQAAYGAANAYLDAFAEARRRRGRPALSVQWGPFEDVGLAAADDTRGARLAERGLGGIDVGQAWPALDAFLGQDLPVVGYFPLDMRRLLDAYPDTAAAASWQRLSAEADSPGADVSAAEFLNTLKNTADPEARTDLAEAKVRDLAGRVLRLDPARIDRDSPFKALGLDSLMSLELRNRLEAAFGLRLSPTLLWAYGTPRALATALCERVR